MREGKLKLCILHICRKFVNVELQSNHIKIYGIHSIHTLGLSPVCVPAFSSGDSMNFIHQSVIQNAEALSK